MSEMLERVAKAIYDAGHDDHGGLRVILPREIANHLARAAIAAMREPTAAMLDAGPGDPYLDAHVWGKIIDAALATPQQLQKP